MSRKKMFPLFITGFYIVVLSLINIPDIIASQGSAELKFLRHSVSPETPLPGGRFSIEVSIQNAGKGQAQNFRVEARSGQTTLGVTEFKGLSPGARDSQSISLTYPGQPMAVPGASPREICVDLIINPLKNANASVDRSRRVCISAKTIAQPQPLPQQPPSPGEEPSIPIQPQIPTPSKPEAPLKPIEIKIASLDVNKGKFELELENKDKKRDLRNPLVEVEINQAGKKRQIYKDHLPILPADGTRMIRIPVPEDTKPTDSLEIKVNKMLIGQKGLKGLIEAELDKERIKSLIPPDTNNRQPVILRNPGHPPQPATASCSPTVYMWLNPMPIRPENFYFNDESFNAHYSVDCATSISISDIVFYSTASELSAAERGGFMDFGGGYRVYEDAVTAGVLTGIRSIERARAGTYSWEISACNRRNPSNPCQSERLTWNILNRPRFDSSCAPYQDCITNWVQRIISIVERRVINNEARLDERMDVFRTGALNLRVFGLRLITSLQFQDGFNHVCAPCPGHPTCSAGFDPATSTMHLNFEVGPHDVTYLHELSHKAGFNHTDLPRTSYSASQIEDMAFTFTDLVFVEGGIYSIGCP